jgi:glycosyltransferase involved in cell wall biosynthesis
MPAPRRIIFWQPIDSPHQDAFLEAVAEQFPGEVILGVERPFAPERAAQGWPAPQHSLVKVVNISSPANHAALAAHTGPDSLHVFSGFFSHPLVWSGFRSLAPSQAKLAIYSEAPEQPPLTGWLKRLRGRWLAARWSSRVAFVLAVGGIGCEFFSAIGFPKSKIIPFGYYVAETPAPAAQREHDGVFRFISAGQLIHRKGIDLLIRACATLPQTGWQLDVYGDGPERPSLERLSSSLQLSDRISFRGTLPNDRLRAAIAAADCAVLPSRFDGWGMLVNEALAVGTPIICTSACGSASILNQIPAPESPGRKPRDEPHPQIALPTPAALAGSLTHALRLGPPPHALRIALAAAVRERGSAKAAARRFLSAISVA